MRFQLRRKCFPRFADAIKGFSSTSCSRSFGMGCVLLETLPAFRLEQFADATFKDRQIAVDTPGQLVSPSAQLYAADQIGRGLETDFSIRPEQSLDRSDGGLLFRRRRSNRSGSSTIGLAASTRHQLRLSSPPKACRRSIQKPPPCVLPSVTPARSFRALRAMANTSCWVRWPIS